MYSQCTVYTNAELISGHSAASHVKDMYILYLFMILRQNLHSLNIDCIMVLFIFGS